MCMYRRVYVSVCVCVCVYACMCMCRCRCVCIETCVCVCATYIRACTRVRVRACVHPYVCIIVFDGRNLCHSYTW